MKLNFPNKDLYYQVRKNLVMEIKGSWYKEITFKKGYLIKIIKYDSYSGVHLKVKTGEKEKIAIQWDYYQISFIKFEELDLIPIVIEKKEKKTVKPREWLRITNAQIFHSTGYTNLRLGEYDIKNTPSLYKNPGKYKSEGRIEFSWKSNYNPIGSIPIKFTLKYTEKKKSEVVNGEIVRRILYTISLDSIEIFGIEIQTSPNDLSSTSYSYLRLDTKSPIKKAMRNYFEQHLDKVPLSIKAIKEEIESRELCKK